MRNQAAILSAFICCLALSLAIARACYSQDAVTPQAQLYFFTNPACGPCRNVEPSIHRLAKEGFSVTSINTMAQPNWVQQFQVTRTPTTIMVVGNRIVERQVGYVDYNTLRQWFSQHQPSPQRNLRQEKIGGPSISRPDVLVAPPIDAAAAAGYESRLGPNDNSSELATKELPATMHHGTPNAATAGEKRALNATVRLKVADPEGVSFATGTIIHRHGNESLVLTCGHVFRDSNGTGKITAEYDFANGRPRSTSGRLMSCDADDRDIALVIIDTGNDAITPISIAPQQYPVQRSDQMFSIGCDRGADPTIRHTRIKNLARYNGVEKYDIYGRPVDGRSGGGLFTAGGQLVGVCNAAAVDFDEGIYVSLRTVYWQLDQAKLTHLFVGDRAIAQNLDSAPEIQLPTDRMPTHTLELPSTPESTLAVRPAEQIRADERVRYEQDLTPVTQRAGSSDDVEMIVIFRSRSNPNQSQTYSVPNPSNQLIGQIQQICTHPDDRDPSRLAQLRQEMPAVLPLESRQGEVRAQSHR